MLDSAVRVPALEGSSAQDSDGTLRSSQLASSAPSPARTHPGDDGDLSPFRKQKRPRLDSGSRVIRSQSADTVLSPSTKGHDRTAAEDVGTSRASLPPPVATTPSKITLHVRNSIQPSSSISILDESLHASTLVASSTSNDVDASPKGEASIIAEPVEAAPAADKPTDISDNTAVNGESDRADQPASGMMSFDGSTDVIVPGSSPSLPIEIEDPEDLTDEVDAIDTIEIEDDDLVERYISDLPYCEPGSTPLLMAKQLAKYIDTPELDGHFLHLFLRWFDEQDRIFRSQKRYWADLYFNNYSLWEFIGQIMKKIFTRSCFGANIAEQSIPQVVPELIAYYLRCVSRMVHFDADILPKRSPSENASQLPISNPHIDAINSLLDFDNPLRQLLVQRYGLSNETLLQSIADTWLGERVLRPLLRIFQYSFERIHQSSEHFPISSIALNVLSNITRFLNPIYEHFPQPHSAYVKQDDNVQLMETAFLALARKLEQDLNKQNDPLTHEFRREILTFASSLLFWVMAADEDKSRKYLERFVGSFEAIASESYPVVTSLAWKIKLMKQYICNARMELRVLGTDTMASELVNFFNHNRDNPKLLRTETIPPVFQCIARILVTENIVDYIVGVSSHPQIIGRSHNIIGFLVVTNNFTQQKIDLIWDNVLTSQDPRMVTALLNALTNVIRTHLTNTEEELYMCKKLYEKPPPSLGPEAAQFILNLFMKLQISVPPTDPGSDARSIVMTSCLTLVSQCAAISTMSSSVKDIQTEADGMLRLVAQSSASQTRQNFYKTCVASAQSGATQAAWMQALLSVLRSHLDDIQFVTEELNLTSLAMDSFTQQIQKWKVSMENLNPEKLKEQLDRRLELVLHLFINAPQSASNKTTTSFWSHLVGRDALALETRELAWQWFESLIVRTQSDVQHAFFDLLYEQYIPRVGPDNYVPAFMTFVERVVRYKLSTANTGDGGAEEVLELPGFKLMWQIILTAPDFAAPEKAIRFLSTFYVENHKLLMLTNTSMEQNHVSLVQKCVQTMDECFKRARNMQENSERDSMDIVEPEKMPLEQMSFRRIVRLLLTVLGFIRARPEFRSPVTELIHTNQNLADGKDIKIPFEVHRSDNRKVSQFKRWLTINDLATREDLHLRICLVSGFAKSKVIWGGSIWRWTDNPSETLADCGAPMKGQMLIIEDSSDLAADSPKKSIEVKTQFERELLRHFETLYKFMDGADMISETTFRLLESFEPHESIRLLAADEAADASTLFPSGHVYKHLYSLRCLTSLLDDQKCRKAKDVGFLTHGIHIMEWLLAEQPLPEDVEERQQYLHTSDKTVIVLNSYIEALDDSQIIPFRSPEAIVSRLIEVLRLFLRAPEGASAVGQIYELLLVAAGQCPEAWMTLAKSSRFHKLHDELLILNPNPNIRISVLNTIKATINRLLQQQENKIDSGLLLDYYWSMVIGLFPTTLDQPQSSVCLYELASYLFAEIFVTKSKVNGGISTADSTLLQQYLKSWSSMFLKYEAKEFVGREVQDPVVIGLADLLSECLRLLNVKDSMKFEQLRPFASGIWHKYLFPPSVDDIGYKDENPPKTPLLDSTSRHHVYLLLSQLTLRHSVEASEWVSHLIRNISPDAIPHRWTIDRSRIVRPESGYLGLRNLGNTCYMNSLLTQLYMNPAFRAFMINQGGDEHSRGLLKETQELFCSLQDSFNPSGDATRLTEQIRTYTGEGINITEQMDVEEFFNLLFEQWEEPILSPEIKRAFRSFYGGKIIYQIKSKECEHVSEREEPCYNIQLDVQGKQNLYESLQAYIQGDVMQGDNKYKCEKCGGKFVDAVRRTCLKEIPDHLILHLKRFEYDISLQRRNKINDYFEFPMDIDMSSYTFDQLSNPDTSLEQDNFELVGVLVHKGQAEHGHYISYIRARPEVEGKPPRWLLFDDSDVTEFNPQDITETCFGGYSESRDIGYTTLGPSIKAYSAYMLFYQRASTIKVAAVSPNAESLSLAKAPMPQFISKSLVEQNAQILRSYCLFGEPTQLFVRDLCSQLTRLDHDSVHDHSTQQQIISAVWPFICRVTSRTKDIPELDVLLTKLQEVSSKCGVCAFWVIYWLTRHIEEFRNLLTRTPQPRVRHRMQAFIRDCLKELRNHPDCYGLDVESDLFQVDEASQNRIFWIVLQAFKIMARHEPPHLVRGWDEFFMLLSDIANFGHAEALAFVLDDFLLICLEQLTMHQHVRIRQEYPYYTKLSAILEKKGQAFNSVSCLLFTLLKRIYFVPHPPDHDANSRLDAIDDDHMMLPISADEHQLLHLRSKDGLIWLNKLFEKWDLSKEPLGFVPGKILEVLLRNLTDPQFRHWVVFTLNDGIEGYAAGVSETFIRAAPICFRHCVAFSEVHSLLRAVNNLVNGSEGHSGKYLFEFYNTIRHIKNDDVPPPEPTLGSFYKEILLAARIFAPPLLTYPTDQLVRYQTQSMMEEILFQYPPMLDTSAESPTDLAIARTKAVRMLFKQCRRKAEELLELDTLKSILQPLIFCMDACLKYLNDLAQLGPNADIMKNETEDSLSHEVYQTIEQAFQVAPVAHDDEFPQSALSTDLSEDDFGEDPAM